MQDTDAYTQARKRAEAKYGFFVHAIVFAVVMTMLIVIDLMTSPAEVWFIWPLVGWGIAVALHATGVFLLGGRNRFVDTLTERELRKTGSL